MNRNKASGWVVVVSLLLMVGLGLVRAQLGGGASEEVTVKSIMGDIPPPPPLNLPLVSSNDVPETGIFWSAQHGDDSPPYPFNPVAELDVPIYSLGDNMYLVDDRNVDYAALFEARITVNMFIRAAMNSGEPPPPGDGGGGEGGTNDWNTYTGYGDLRNDTTNLWLEITNVEGSTANCYLHNATNQVYAILSKTNLLAASWQIEAEVWPDTNLAANPFTVELGDRPQLFLQARDWTGIDENGNGIPDWWEWRYFGTLALSATHLDADGNTILDDYTNNQVPVVFKYSSIKATNNYVHTSTASLELDVTGAPYYVAVLVDDANVTNAIWSAYSSTNMVVSLGLTEGWHQVGIGLRGHGDDPFSGVWMWKRLKLDTTPPALTVTNPTSTIVTQPMIQLQGYSAEALQSISYDITNAAGLLTNQQVLVLNQFYDTNTWELTTNTFQAFDVELTNGVNTITLSAMDLAGNVTTASYEITVDYSSKTNPPVLQMAWPPTGTTIAGETFTFRGWVDDPTATVTAMLLGTDGTTNTFPGAVERNGNVWIEDLPLSGTNSFTLLVADAAGNTTQTNFMVVQGAVSVTVDTPTWDLWQPTTTLNGTVSDSTFSVSVNGRPATMNGNYWYAVNVPVNSGGVAIFTLMAYPPNSTNGIPQEVNVDKPTRLYVFRDVQTREFESDTRDDSIPAGGQADSDDGSEHSHNHQYYHHYWKADAGGVGSRFQDSLSETWDWQGHHTADAQRTAGDMTWDGAGAGTEVGLATNATTVLHYTNSLSIWNRIVNEYCSVEDHPSYMKILQSTLDPSDKWIRTHSENYTRKAQTTWHLRTGGKALSKQKNLWRLSANASKVLDKQVPEEYWSVSTEQIPYTQIAIGTMGRLGADGNLWLALPDNDEFDVTPYVAGEDFYLFNVQTQKYTLTIIANNDPLKPNRVVNGANHAIGERIDLSPIFVPSLPEGTQKAVLWSLAPQFINAFKVKADAGVVPLDGLENAYDYAYGLTEFRVDPARLRQEQTFAWWLTGSTNGYEAKMLKLGMNLAFANGQQVVLIAKGLIGMHSPTIAWHQDEYQAGVVHGQAVIIETQVPDASGLDTITITNTVLQCRVGSYTNDNDRIRIKATSSSLRQGHFCIAQLIKRDSITESFNDWRLDNSFPYYQQPDNYHSITPNSQGTAYLQFEDGPSCPIGGYMYDQFEQFFMYRPDTAGSIWVTLGTANWEWRGEMTSSTNSPSGWEWVTPPYCDHSQSIQQSTRIPEWTSKKFNFGAD